VILVDAEKLLSMVSISNLMQNDVPLSLNKLMTVQFSHLLGLFFSTNISLGINRWSDSMVRISVVVRYSYDLLLLAHMQ